MYHGLAIRVFTLTKRLASVLTFRAVTACSIRTVDEQNERIQTVCGNRVVVRRIMSKLRGETRRDDAIHIVGLDSYYCSFVALHSLIFGFTENQTNTTQN